MCVCVQFHERRILRAYTRRSFGKGVKVENVKLAATRAAIARSFVNTPHVTYIYVYIYMRATVGISSRFRATVIKRSIRDYTRSFLS